MTTTARTEFDAPQTVWFHGTTPEIAAIIEREGFKEGTWFAAHMEDAVGYGGPCVFFVKVTFPKERAYSWQVCCINSLPSSTIQNRYDFLKASVSEPEHPPKDNGNRAQTEAVYSMDSGDTDADSRVADLTRQLSEARAAKDEESAIVDRVWKAMSITDYAGASGHAIDQIVANWKLRAEQAESALAEAREQLREATEALRDASAHMRFTCPELCGGAIARIERFLGSLPKPPLQAKEASK